MAIIENQPFRADPAGAVAGSATPSGIPRVELFGIPFAPLTFKHALEALVDLATSPAASYVVTANVDHVVRFRRMPLVRHLYEQADLVLADGMPVVWASRFVGRPLPERVAGSDLFPALSARAAKEGLSIFLLGGDPGTAEESARVLRERHPELRIAGTACPAFGFERDPEANDRIVAQVRDAGTDILFVALGSPKQEEWIARHRAACGAKLSIGVGISFSFLCGQVSRAPRWMQRVGMEWLHRLAQEPGRLWKRYLWDDAVFPRLVLQQWWAVRLAGSAKTDAEAAKRPLPRRMDRREASKGRRGAVSRSESK